MVENSTRIDRTAAKAVLAIAFASVLAGCGGSGSAPSGTQAVFSAPSSTARPAESTTIGPSPSPASSGSPAGVAMAIPYGCDASTVRCQDFAPGTYVTDGRWAFLRGLQVTLLAGWSSSEQDAGEFNLHRVTDPNANRVLLFWRDVEAVDQNGKVAPNVGKTPADLTAFLSRDPSVIATAPENVTIGDGIRAISIVITVSPKAVLPSPNDCPGLTCAGPLRDFKHWDGVFGITINSNEDPTLGCPCSHAARLSFATIGGASDPHTFVVAVLVYGPDPKAALAAFQTQVQPIIDSLRIPAVVDN